MRLMKIAMLAATLLPLSSFAALGGAPVANASAPLVLRAAASQSVSDSASASASASPAAGSQPASAVTATAPYTMRQSVDANGVTIREYLLPANVVFAVTWQGRSARTCARCSAATSRTTLPPDRPACAAPAR